MGSRREHRPRRSDGEAARESATERRYRFKSYLEANTVEQERFDAMRHSLPTKIDEVMASFREDKLTVHQHDTISGVDDDAQPKRRRLQWWPWAMGGVLLLSIAVVWLNEGHGDHAATSGDEVTAATSSPAPAVQLPIKSPVLAAQPLPAVSLKPVASHPVLSVDKRQLAMLTAPAHKPAIAAHPVALLTGQSETHVKPLPVKHHKAVAKAAPAAQPDHYSEDLSDLLRH